jgi:post-segregation antitoxin (ccd killing protein)
MKKTDPEKRPPGRPQSVKGKPVRVYIDDETIERARKLGNGNLSEGIRKALEIAVGRNYV